MNWQRARVEDRKRPAGTGPSGFRWSSILGLGLTLPLLALGLAACQQNRTEGDPDDLGADRRAADVETADTAAGPGMDVAVPAETTVEADEAAGGAGTEQPGEEAVAQAPDEAGEPAGTEPAAPPAPARPEAPAQRTATAAEQEARAGAPAPAPSPAPAPTPAPAPAPSPAPAPAAAPAAPEPAAEETAGAAATTGATETAAADTPAAGGQETAGEQQTAGGEPQAQEGQQPGKASLVASEEVYNGWKVYAANCERCHGQDVLGSAIAPDLRRSVNESSVAGGGPLSRDAFITTVKEGRIPKGMPAWGPVLSDEQMTQAYAYVMARAKGELAPGRPQRAGN